MKKNAPHPQLTPSAQSEQGSESEPKTASDTNVPLSAQALMAFKYYRLKKTIKIIWQKVSRVFFLSCCLLPPSRLLYELPNSRRPCYGVSTTV
jgi:hypothetical protein